MQRIIGTRHITAGRDVKINRSRTQEPNPQVSDVLRLQALQLLLLIIVLSLQITLTINDYHRQAEQADIRQFINAVHIKNLLID
jgi:hypothetical protein